MDGEDQTGEGGAPAEGDGGGGGRQGDAEQTEGEEVESKRGGGVEEEAGEVGAGGRQAPEAIIEAEREPGQGDVVTCVEGGEHPAELIPAETAVVGIVEEIQGIVPRGEAVAECREESDERDDHDETRREPARSHPDRPRQPSSSCGEAPSSDAARRAFWHACESPGLICRARGNASRPSFIEPRSAYATPRLFQALALLGRSAVASRYSSSAYSSSPSRCNRAPNARVR